MAHRGRVPRPHRLEVHWSADEWRDMRERALAAGAASFSAYVRDAALRRPLPAISPRVPEANVAQYATLGHAVANLNQLAKHLNVGNIVTDRDLLPVLRAVREEVQALRRALLGGAA